MKIEEYFGTLQQSFVEIWKNHLETGKYTAHKALNEYYDEIVEKVDALVEAWMGMNGKVGKLVNTLETDFDNPIDYLVELKKFTKQGRKELIDEDDTELWSTVDDILNLINSTLYKLKELKESREENTSSRLSLKDFLLNESVNEARVLEYNVSFLDVTTNDGIPVTVTVKIDSKYSKVFEEYLEKEQGNTIYHAECVYTDFEI